MLSFIYLFCHPVVFVIVVVDACFSHHVIVVSV